MKGNTRSDTAILARQVSVSNTAVSCQASLVTSLLTTPLTLRAHQ
jgi:hypothetical protein